MAIFADGLCVPDVPTLQYFERTYGVAVDHGRLVLHSLDHSNPGSDVELVTLFQKLRCSGERLPRRLLHPLTVAASSRHCTLAEFWLGAPLYPWLSRVAAENVDWRLWAYCNMLKDVAKFPSRPVLILTDETAPDASRYIGPSEIRQVTGANITVGVKKARCGFGQGNFAFVYCLLLMDLCDEECVDLLVGLGELCRIGGLICVTAAIGGTTEWHQTFRARLKQKGIDTEFDLEILGGEPECRRYGDVRMEPYIYPEIGGAARVVASLRFRRIAFSDASV